MGSDNLFHKNKIRQAKSFARRKASKSPYETILLVCEGKTEFNYFCSLIKFYKLNTANIFLIEPSGSAPINVVNSAIEYAENNSGIDHVMCIFDRDEHSTYQKALDKIKNCKLKPKAKSEPKFYAITSTPCFEIWLLLHFIFTTKEFCKTGNQSASENLARCLRKYIPEYGKNIDDLFCRLGDKRLQIAIVHSKKLAAHNKKTNSENPETNIYELVERLINLKQ